ncbi:hypothetical protein [Nocardia wallacei]|uniref:hypothetical protein n=1 Tax=Nocardia wallacei TaxID=480035 RepID=UPI002456D6BB|nr:hypothetical protein [Nocardia wallacei]
MVRYADRKARIRLVSRHVGVRYTEAQRLLDATPADPDAARWILPRIDAQVCRKVVQNRYEQLLAAAIADLAAAVPPMPAVIRLAYAWRGLATVGYLSDRLHWYAVIPADDFFNTMRDACADALIDLGHELTPPVFRKHALPQYLSGYPDPFEWVMHQCVGIDATSLAGHLVTIGDRLHQLLTTIAADDTVIPPLRTAATRVIPVTESIRRLYGDLR